MDYPNKLNTGLERHLFSSLVFPAQQNELCPFYSGGGKKTLDIFKNKTVCSHSVTTWRNWGNLFLCVRIIWMNWSTGLYAPYRCWSVAWTFRKEDITVQFKIRLSVTQIGWVVPQSLEMSAALPKITHLVSTRHKRLEMSPGVLEDITLTCWLVQKQLHLLMGKVANKHIIWTWYATFGTNVNLEHICGLQKH